MSELEDVLAGLQEPGVHSWSSPADAAEVQHEVEAAGWRFVHLDTSTVEDKSGFLDRAAAAFDLPGYFGRNWDAFADSLSDVRSDPGTVVLWEGWRPFAETDEQQYAVALDILRERAESRVGGSFAVLLREDEPEPEPYDVEPGEE
jgi:RNAse (barnase) inhibitor barstar